MLAWLQAPTGVMPTPADSVEEFKTNTANQTADFNSSAGAEVKVVTKRGTNAWHGTAYEYYLDNNFSANTWDNNFNGRSGSQLPLQPLRRRRRRSAPSKGDSGREDIFLRQLRRLPISQLHDDQQESSLAKHAAWNFAGS